jgi:hypothetical protein
MIEALTLLISSVTLILQRKDRRTDRSPSAHLRDDLLALHEAMATWVEYMGRTNESVLEWYRRDKPKDDETGVLSLGNRQAVRHIRVNGQFEKVRAALNVYAPELAEAATAILEARDAQLTTMASELYRLSDAPDEEFAEYRQQLRDTEARLVEAVEQLRLFIVAMP